MTESASTLSSWATYYAIVGSSGGALVGLQFVVIALVADKRERVAEGSLSAFGTPTVVHLASALVVSAIMSAPWPSLMPLSVALALGGLGGLAYGVTVVRRARRQVDYEPVWEDWLWHAALPFACYATLTAMAVVLGSDPQLAVFAIGAVALGLLLIGIHNAWDTVVYIMVSGVSGSDDRTTKTD
jgi:hypothetical protein